MAYKLYERILEERLRRRIENTIKEKQTGFRAVRSTQDLMFVIRQIAENILTADKELYCCAIDLEKAFIVSKAKKFGGMNSKLISAVKNPEVFAC